MDLTKVSESTVLPSSCTAENAKQQDKSIDFIQHLSSGVNEKLSFSDISHSQSHPNLNSLHSESSSMELSASLQFAVGTNCTADIRKILDGAQLTPSALKAERDQKGTKKPTGGKAKKRKDKIPVVHEEQISFDGSTDLATSSESVQQLLQAVRSQVLPFPLPVPVYSQTVQAARASGNVLSERATIIRETVKFFLVYKYWWTSEDYDRIAELVVSQFPELRDSDVSAAEPCYSKVRLDLSMCARNFRRIAKNQKRRGNLQSLNTAPVYSEAKTGVKASKMLAKSSSREVEAAASPDPILLPSHILPHTAHSAHPTTTTTMTAHGIREMGSALLITSANGGSSTVLPPVAHFLAHPSVAHSSGHSQMSTGTAFSSVSQPAASAVKETVAYPSAEVSASPQESKRPGEDVRPPNTVARRDNFLENCNAAASAWRSEAMLPDPLPVPPYSNKRRLRAELSQAARNVRRREMMNRKRAGLSAADTFSAVGTVVKPAAGGQQLSTDFCNELLTAASIIESRTAALHQKDLDNSSELHSRLLGEVGILNAGLLNENQKVTSLDHADSYEKIEATDSVNLAKLSSEEASFGLTSSVKQEIGEELEQYQLLQAQQAWLSAQVSQALSLQAFTGLSAQAFSVAHLSCSPISHHATAEKSATGNSALQAQASSHLQGSAAGHEEMISPLSSCTSDEGSSSAVQVDRMSAMAMWRSTCLPDPLPTPPYSLNVLRARDSGNTASARPRIIRETTQFFLSLKMWWTTQDYERIADLVMQQFPDLQNVHHIKKDLGTCARNMRRRLPLSRNKFLSGEQLMQVTAPMQEGEHGDTRLGELANMAVREAQDKDKFDLASSVSLTPEQRDALAFSLLDQGAARLASLCPQYEAFGSQATSIAQILACKRNLTDSLDRNSDLNAAQKNLTDLLERKSELNVARKLTGLDSGSDLHSKQLISGETVIHQDTASKCKKKKKEPSLKGLNYHKCTVIDHIENKSDVANTVHVPISQEQKVLSDTEAVYHSPQVAQHVSTLSFDMVPAHHQHAQFIYPQPDNKKGKIPSSEDEAPINLTCNSETVKQTKVQKLKSKGTKKAMNIDETFNAREQVWLPHGSPYKKGGQNVFKALPSPLPVPKYSQKLLKAQEEGTINRHRSEIIRETARFFLGFKYWWSSADYSRISELVVSQFPELRDTIPLSGQPLYRRVQRDLSMCARNLRRKNSRCQRLSESDVSFSDASKENEKSKKVKKEVAVKQEVMENQSSNDAAQNYLGLEGSHSDLVNNPTRLQSEAGTTHIETHVDRGHGVADPSAYSVSGMLTQTSVSGESLTLPPFASMASTSNSASAVLSSLASHQLMPVLSTLSYPSAFHIGTNKEQLQNDSKTQSKVRCSPKTSKPHIDMAKINAAPNTLSPRSVAFSKGSSLHGEMKASRFSISDSRLLTDTSVAASSLSQTHAWESRLAGNTCFDKVFVNPEHGSDLQTQLTKLWHEGKFFDASLEVDDCRLPVHKLVLLAASPYLQNTYSHANPTAHLEVNLPRETGISAAQDFLKYMYEGVLRITPASVTALRRIAIMLQIEQLSLYCDEYLCWLTSVSTTCYPLVAKNAAQQERLPRPAASLEEQVQVMVAADAETFAQFTSDMALTASPHALTHDASHAHVRSVTRQPDLKANAVVRSGKKRMQPFSPVKSVYHVDKGQLQHGAGSMAKNEAPVVISYNDMRGQQLDHQALRGLGLTQLSNTGTYFSHHLSAAGHEEEEATAACPTSSAQPVIQFDLEGNVATADSSGDSGQAGIDGEQVMATLMTSTDMEVDGDGCVEVECASENLQQFAEEAGRQVVEEVVIEAEELLQDVEVAACETVECSLLPQTYCSSPHSTASQANSILQTMASQWAAEHYAHAPLDEATAQQFAAVLQERMYGQRTSSNASFHKTSTVGHCETENSKALLEGCAPFVSVQSRPSKDSADLALDSVHLTGNAAYTPDMTHLLPQTYCASSQSPTPVTSQ